MSRFSGYNKDNVNITNCNEVCNYVKRLGASSTLSFLIWYVLISAVSANTSHTQRHVMLPAGIESSWYPLLEKAVRHSPLFTLNLPDNAHQIVRLQKITLKDTRPIYLTQRPQAPETLQLQLTLTHEIWQKQQLLWTETLTRSQQWRQPGNRAFSVGQSPTQHLYQMPRGALNPLQNMNKQTLQRDPFKPFIFHQLTHSLTQHYLQWQQKQQEQTS